MLNIILDLLLVVKWKMGVGGAAWATVIAQYHIGESEIGYYLWKKEPELRFIGNGISLKEACSKEVLPEVVRFSLAASVQQSVMNFGILMIQGLIDGFGTAVMAAYAAAVKIDSFAYMPAQEFSNSFSIFTSQNSWRKR